MSSVLTENLNNYCFLEVVTAKQLSEILGVTKRTVNYWCQKQKIKRKKGFMRGGTGNLINIKRLPSNIKNQFLSNYNKFKTSKTNNLKINESFVRNQNKLYGNIHLLSGAITISNNQNINNADSSDNSVPHVVEQGQNINNNSFLPPAISFENTNILESNNSLIPEKTYDEIKNLPEKAKKVARARESLIIKWKRFRNKQKSLEISLKESDKLFLKEYQLSDEYLSEKEILGVISTPSTLYNWLAKYNKSKKDWKSLIPEYNYNKGLIRSFKLSEKEKEEVLNLLLTPEKLKVETAIKYAQEKLKNAGFAVTASIKTYRRFVNDWKEKHFDKWTLMREGQKSVQDEVLPTLLRDWESINVGDCIMADGHRCNFNVKHPQTGEPVRPMLVAYMDAKSRYILGYELMTEETTYCIASAFRNSVLNLGKFPLTSYQDNGKAFRSKYFKNKKANKDDELLDGVFERLNVETIFSIAYNAKAKALIERFFGTFDTQFQKLMPTYVGNNIENKPAYLMRNEKLHKKLHEEKYNGYVPTIEEAKEFINKYFNYYHNNPHPTIKDKTKIEIFEAGKGTGLDINELDELMMASEVRTLQKEGIRFKKDYYISEKLIPLMKRQKLMIKYSLFDLSYISVYDIEGRYICRAQRRELVHPLACITGTKFDETRFKQQIKDQKSQIKDLKKQFLETNSGKPCKSIGIDTAISQKQLKKSISVISNLELKERDDFYSDAEYIQHLEITEEKLEGIGTPEALRKLKKIKEAKKLLEAC